MKYQILNGDNIEILKTLPENSIDSIITDPPYGIAFLGKEWDHKRATETTSKIAQLHNLPSGMKHTTLADDLEFQYWLRERWIECLRVLKPGGHLLAFSAARTYHHMAMSLQTAGFEIRDQIMWIYSSGFPKSQDIGRSIQRSLGVKETRKQKLNTNGGIANMGDRLEHQTQSLLERKPEVDITVVTDPEAKAWEGWGTALKPAHEPIALARKPMKLSIAKNAQKWGTGALNIDAGRGPYIDLKDMESAGLNWNKTGYETGGPRFIGSGEENKKVDKPAEKKDNINDQGRFPSNVIGEIAEPYQKYFYCPKVSRAERHTGHEMPPAMFGQMEGCYDENGQRYAVELDRREGNVGNNHPTVKPVELMKYLIKLVTPPLGRVLDPFNGSGSTGMAAVELGHEYIGIEQDEKYCEISRRRITAHFQKADPLRASGLFD